MTSQGHTTHRQGLGLEPWPARPQPVFFALSDWFFYFPSFTAELPEEKNGVFSGILEGGSGV